MPGYNLGCIGILTYVCVRSTDEGSAASLLMPAGFG